MRIAIPSNGIEIDIEQEMEALTAKASSMASEVQALLKSQKPQKYNPNDPHRAKTLWVIIREIPGSQTISIVWRILKYFHHETKKPYYQDIARGKGFCIPRRRFVSAVRGYHPEIQSELWGYEKIFAEIRLRQSLLSQARQRLVLFQKRGGKPLEEID